MEAPGGELGRSHCPTGCVRGRGDGKAHGLLDMEERTQDPARDEHHLPKVSSKGRFSSVRSRLRPRRLTFVTDAPVLRATRPHHKDGCGCRVGRQPTPFRLEPRHDALRGGYLVPFGVGGVVIYDLGRFHVSVRYIYGVAVTWDFGEPVAELSAGRSWQMERMRRRSRWRDSMGTWSMVRETLCFESLVVWSNG